MESPSEPWVEAADQVRGLYPLDLPDPHDPRGSGLYNARMARYTLVYGVRLIPEGTLKGVDEATLKLADGSSAGLTLHTFDGTIPQLRRSLDRSLDAFFDLLPGAADEDVEAFGD